MSRTITAVRSATHAVGVGQVKARAVIGSARKAGWSMLVDDAHVAAGGAGSGWVALGDGDALRGRQLEVSAVMTDAQPSLSLTVEVVGPGTTKVDIAHPGADGDSAAYSIIVIFA